MVALAVPGLGGLVRSELRSLDGVTVGQYGNDSRADLVLFEHAHETRTSTTSAPPKTCSWRSAAVDGPTATTRAGSREGSGRVTRTAAIGSRVDGRATFRVIVRVLQERSFRRTALREAFTDLIQRDCPRWSFADPAEIEIWVLEYRPGAFVAGVRVSDASMRQHGGRDSERRGALRPTVAAAMVGLAGKARGVLIDPCCGSGTILEEATSAGWRRGGERHRPGCGAGHGAQCPRAGGARRRPSPSRRRRRGRRVRVESPVRSAVRGRGRPDRLAHRVLAEMTRVTRPKGRVVVLVPEVAKRADPEGAPRDPAHADRAARDEDDDLELRAHVKGVALLGPTSSGKTGLSLELGGAAPRGGSSSGGAQCRLASGVPLHGHRHEQDRAP